MLSQIGHDLRRETTTNGADNTDQTPAREQAYFAGAKRADVETSALDGQRSVEGSNAAP